MKRNIFLCPTVFSIVIGTCLYHLASEVVLDMTRKHFLNPNCPWVALFMQEKQKWDVPLFFFPHECFFDSQHDRATSPFTLHMVELLPLSTKD